MAHINCHITFVVDFLFLGTKFFQSRCINGTPFARYILITAERPEFDKAILSYPGREFHY